MKKLRVEAILKSDLGGLSKSNTENVRRWKIKTLRRNAMRGIIGQNRTPNLEKISINFYINVNPFLTLEDLDCR